MALLPPEQWEMMRGVLRWICGTNALALGPPRSRDLDALGRDGGYYRWSAASSDNGNRHDAAQYTEAMREMVECRTQTELRRLDEAVEPFTLRPEARRRIERDVESIQQQMAGAAFRDLCRPPTVQECLRSATPAALWARLLERRSPSPSEAVDDPPDRPPALAPPSAKLPTWRPNR